MAAPAFLQINDWTHWIGYCTLMAMLKNYTHKIFVIIICSYLSVLFLPSRIFSAQQDSPETAQQKQEISSKQSLSEGLEEKEPSHKLVRDGLVVEYTSKLSKDKGLTGTQLYEGDYADISFRITDSSTGEPLQGQPPGVWLDMIKSWEGNETQRKTCEERVGLYLQGLIGIRPMIDMNSYFVLAMNRGPTISVIDPVIGITGITKLYAQVNLTHPGADWTKTTDQNHLFVTMPLAEKVAVIDTKSFKVLENIPAGKKPVRISLQPDEKYIWVGNNTDDEKKSGVTVIDSRKFTFLKHIPTGRGHHELAFSMDSRYAFVSNRNEGTISIIDVHKLEKIKDIKTGPLPISMAFSGLSKSLYVADGKEGTITVIDGKTHVVITRIEGKIGLGPIGFSKDNRWGVALNSEEDVAIIIDPSINRIVHKIPVGKKPYQVTFSRSFAYVRSLGTEMISLINLSELGKQEKPAVVKIAIGQKAPEISKDISISDAIVEAPGEAAVLVVSPADETIYYYMEGMNVPMGNFRNYGQRPRAVQVVDRSMQENEPGLYEATVQIPEAGTYDVAFVFESPSILHCFSLTANPDPNRKDKGPAIALEYLIKVKKIKAKEPFTLKFKLTDTETGKPLPDLPGVHVLSYMSPGQNRTVVKAKSIGEGIYEASLMAKRTGAIFVHVECAGMKVNYNDLPKLTLRAVPGKTSQ